MKNLTSDNQHRRNIREWYSQELQDLATVNFIKHSNEEYTSGHLAQVLIKSIETQHERNQIIEKLNSEKIYPGVHYRPLSMTQYYKSKGLDCQDSRRIGSKIISLPCHMGITHKDVVRVANALKTYV